MVVNKNYASEQNNSVLPQHFVTFVEIFFAVVLGSSILEFRSFLFPPDWRNPGFWALICVYFTAASSWVGWHKSTIRYPYTNTKAGYLRSVLDAFIVATYAALLYFGSKVNQSFVAEKLDNSLLWYLWGYFIIFVLYYFSGSVRKTEYGALASRPRLIIIHGGITFIVAIGYTRISNILITDYGWAIWVFVILPLIVMLSYRWLREWRDLPWTVKRKLKVAIDLDGVIVEQVNPVLEKIRQEMKIDLRKCMITDWNYPFANTTIKVEIEKAERDESFVLQMPVMEGAIGAIKKLCNKCRIIIATSREAVTDNWNKKWLEKNGINYESYINTRSMGKKLSAADILIDDYVGNILHFIRNGHTNRQAILFSQPWNQDVSEIADLIEQGRVRIAHSWSAVLALLSCYEPETIEEQKVVKATEIR